MKIRDRSLITTLMIFILLITGLTNAGAQEWRKTVESLQTAFREVSEQVLPVVVEVNVVQVMNIENMDNPFNFFFGWPFNGDNDQDNESKKPKEYRQQGLGSGVLVERKGSNYYILTNNHVINDADEISIKLYDGREYEATLIGQDPLKDLALLSINTLENLPIAKLGDSNEAQVGDWVLAVGNPLGFESTVTSGIISAVGRKSGPQEQKLTDYIQTDAAINQGNSGGALVNLYGEVIGINTWIASHSGGSVGLGFAIPINNARKAISDLINTGNIQYGWLGVNMGDINEELIKQLSLKSENGAFVYNLYINSPAFRAGIQPGDLILKVNDSDIKNSNDLTEAVTSLTPYEKADFTVERDRKIKEITVELGLRELGKNNAINKMWPGISVVPLPEDIRKQLDLAKNSGELVIAYVEDQRMGLQAGDIIKTINKRYVRDLKDFYKIINKSDELSIKVNRKGYELEIVLTKD